MVKGYKLTVAPNGARRRRTDHPALPMTTSEIEKTAFACYQAGADEIHLHVRENDGSHSLDTGRYQEAIDAITNIVPLMAIQITTEAAGKFSVVDQYNCLETLRPRAASISVREMARDVNLAARIYALAAEAGTSVQHILYTPECIAQLLLWRTDGIVPASMSDIIFVLGQYSPEVLAQPTDLAPFLTVIADHNLDWSVCAFGRNEHACLNEAVSQGGNVRLRFENNIEMRDGTLFKDNAASVAEFLQRTETIKIGL